VLTGLVSDDGEPADVRSGVQLDKQGALLVADDVGNTVWRVTPATKSAAPLDIHLRHCEKPLRRSNPSVRYAARWIASLRSQ
jgi:hypothetical protein